MSPSLQRAMILYQQSRFDLAERELRQALGSDPNDPMAHAFLSLCLSARERHTEATREAEEAVRLGPDLEIGYYALATVLLHRNHTESAEAAISEAIRLDPTDPDYYALLGTIRMNRRRWREALEAAEQGLAFDPEHVECNNVRALALVRLGRRDEAGATIAAALRRDPEDAFSHANQGWALLHEGQPVKAMEHFREALRIEPQMEWARAGIVEAMKAKNPIYRVMLGYFLAMSRLSRKAQWAVMLAIVLGPSTLRSIGRAHPELAPITGLAALLIFAFVVMTWISVPLFNLLLRLNRFGRLALSEEQVRGTNWLGAYLLSGIACLIVALVKNDPRALEASIAFGVLLLPVGGTHLCPAGWPRDAMKAISLGLTLIGPGAIALMMYLSPSHPISARAENLHKQFYTAVVLSTWLGVFLAQTSPRR